MAGQAVACPRFPAPGARRGPGVRAGPQGRRTRREAALTPGGRPRILRGASRTSGGEAASSCPVDGTVIWTPAHDQRQCSFSTAFPGGRDVGRRETAAHTEGPRRASTNDRWPSRRVTGLLGSLRSRPLPSVRRSWGCFITAGPLGTDRPGGNPALCPYLVCAPVPGGPARCGGNRNRRPRHVRLSIDISTATEVATCDGALRSWPRPLQRHSSVRQRPLPVEDWWHRTVP